MPFEVRNPLYVGRALFQSLQQFVIKASWRIDHDRPDGLERFLSGRDKRAQIRQSIGATTKMSSEVCQSLPIGCSDQRHEHIQSSRFSSQQ